MSRRVGAPTFRLMTEFLIELYLSPGKPGEVEHLTSCARAAAKEQSAKGVSVRYVRSISVPEEQTCFVFYDAPSPEAASGREDVLSVLRSPNSEHEEQQWQTTTRY